MPNKPQPPSVLFVDDDPDLREVVAVTLEQAGIEIETSKGLTDALKALKKKRYTIIVIDVHLDGERNGLEVMRAARRSDRNRKTPMILASGAIAGDALAEAKKLGGVEVLTKPFALDDLLRLVDAHKLRF